MSDSRSNQGQAIELLALALASLSVLGCEIAMTRILSLKYAANQTFLVVSFAVLGLAIGAALADRIARFKWAGQGLPWVGMVVFAAGLTLVLATLYRNIPALGQIVLVPLPFLGVGLCLASLYSRRADRAGLFYAADLIGASIGAFSAATVLDVLPAPTALVLFIVLGLVSAALFMGRPTRSRRHITVAVALLLGIAVVALDLPTKSLGRIPIYPARIKDMLTYLETGRKSALRRQGIPFIEESRWSSFGRTDVVNHVAARQRKMLFVDGAAGTAMFIAPRQMNRATLTELMTRFGPSVVLRLTAGENKRTALAIGPGGGRDVLACRLNGVQRITAVELNRDIVEVVRESAEFNGGIYDDAPGLRIVVEEGRHYLRTSEETFDIIMLALPVTKRGESYGGFALSETYLFTIESLTEYLAHLNDDGQLLIVCHSRQEVGRLLNTFLASEATRNVGPVEAMQRVAVFGDLLITVVITPDPMPAEYWRRLAAETNRLGLARPEARWYYMPTDVSDDGGQSPTRSSPALLSVATGEMQSVAHRRVSSSTFEPDMSPVSDDRPFFYFFTGALPPLVLTVMIASGALMLVMLVWGIWRLRPVDDSRDARRPPGAGEALLWRFSVIGLGAAFMLAEIPLIQRFVFWFGHPTLALGLLLGTLLLATGLGSLLAGAVIRGRLGWTWPIPAALGVFLLLGFSSVQEAIFAGASGAFGDSLARAAAITIPLGLLMGVPFPMLLMAARRRGAQLSIAWLWGINGVASVLGSSSAIAVAMMSGYSTSFRLSGAAYVLTAVIIALLAKTTRERAARD